MHKKRKSPRKEAVNLGAWTLQIHFPMLPQHVFHLLPFPSVTQLANNNSYFPSQQRLGLLNSGENPCKCTATKN